MGNEHFSGKPGELYDNYTAAVNGVKRLKALYGTGMSTLILIQNVTDKEVKFCKATYEASDNGGRWENDPTNIPAGKWMACLHVHRDKAAVGSWGTLKV